jgi:hypothetical protein
MHRERSLIAIPVSAQNCFSRIEAIDRQDSVGSLKSQSRAVDGDLHLNERRCARTGNGVRNGGGPRMQASQAGLPMI